MRELERTNERNVEASGLKWFEGCLSDNIYVLRDSKDLERLRKYATASNRLLVVKFFTEDCYCCRSLSPKFSRIAEQNPDVIFAKLNGSAPEMQPLFHELGITKVPYFHFYRDDPQTPVAHFSASLAPEKLHRLRTSIAVYQPGMPSAMPA